MTLIFPYLNKQGITRIVILYKNIAIKIPNFLYNHQHFLQGCYVNWCERTFYKNMKSISHQFHYKVAPSYFCSWFGLIQIQARCEPMTEELTDKQKEEFEPICGLDNKKENFGWYKGKLVCLDYV